MKAFSIAFPTTLATILAGLLLVGLPTSTAVADGKVVRPVNYKGSLEETMQEAILIHREGDDETGAVQDMILKIRVEGETSDFGWVVPLPNPPKTEKAEDALFEELHRLVQLRSARPQLAKKKGLDAVGATRGAKNEVEVISREVVGSYDVAVVREEKGGGLNAWLEREGYQTLDGAGDVIGFYRDKGYVFACIKVAGTGLDADTTSADLHPLHFQFESGGRDGILFPMRMTGLQEEPFGVNLYVFRGSWLNDSLNGYGFEKQGFRLRHRDWDTDQCVPNDGKLYSHPEQDPYLRVHADKTPKLTAFFKKHHPQERFYMTNISAYGLRPKDVRAWKNDLWLFPYYTNKGFVPFDARENGPAAQ